MWAAKLLGIGVKRFSVGFGKRLVGIRRGETDYCVSMVPLGGYVRLEGDDRPSALSEQRHHMLAHPRWQRVVVYLAGPVANLLLALVIFSVVYWTGFEEVYYEPVVGYVAEEMPEGVASPARLAGLEIGDRVVELDGRPVDSWHGLTEGVIMNTGGSFGLVVERNGRRLPLELTPYTNPELGYGQIGVSPWVEPVITRLTETARELGFEVDDRFVAVNGAPVTDFDSFQQQRGKALESDAETLTVEVERDGFRREVAITPEELATIIGGSIRHIEPDLFEGFGLAASETYGHLRTTYGGLALMLSRRLPVRENLASIISIAYVSGRIAQQGLISFLRFVAGLSVILAIFNLLPIFPLDGGHLTLLLGEMLNRRPMPKAVQRGFTFVGLLIIGGLFIMAIYADVARLFF